MPTKTSSPKSKRKKPRDPTSLAVEIPKQRKGESDKAFHKRVKQCHAEQLAPLLDKDPPPPKTQTVSLRESGEIKGMSELARIVCYWMERFLIVDDEGTRLRLFREQLLFLKALYATDRNGVRKVRQAVYSCGRKNGKSVLAASILLAEMYAKPLAPQGGWFACAAAGSREQSGIIFNRACRLVDRSAQLRKRTDIVESAGRLINRETLNTLMQLGTSVRSTQGHEFHSFALDEYAEARDSRLLSALEKSTRSKSGGSQIIVSTNTTNPGSPMVDLIETIRAGHAAGELRDHIVAVYAADLSKMGVWSDRAIKAANPALSADPPLLDFELIKADRDKARRSPRDRAEYIARRLNASSGTQSGLVDPARWKELACKPGQVAGMRKAHLGKSCILGLDLSKTTDMTSLVAMFPEDGYIEAVSWLPKVGIDDKELLDKVPWTAFAEDGWLRLCPGKVVSYDMVADEIVAALSRWHCMAVYHDPWMFPALKTILKTKGVDADEEDYDGNRLFKEFRQGYRSFTGSVSECERRIETGEFIHLGDPVLAMSMTGVKIETSTNQATDARRPTKSTATSRIDAAVALIMACHPMEEAPAEVQGAPTELIDMFQKGGKIT